MKLFRHPLLLLSFCSTTLTLAACSGGGSDSGMPNEQQQQNDDTVETPSNPTNDPSDTGNDTNTPTSSDSFSEGFLKGNFHLTATATTQSNPLLDCSVTPGAVSVYNGEIIGFIDGYLDVNGTVSSSGQVTGSANSSGTTTASLTGQLSNAGGSGTWNQTGLCSGNWTMQPMDFNQPGDGEAFTLSDDQFPRRSEFVFRQKLHLAKTKLNVPAPLELSIPMDGLVLQIKNSITKATQKPQQATAQTLISVLTLIPAKSTEPIVMIHLE